MATWNTSDLAIFARSIGDMSTIRDQLGQEHTDMSNHRQSHTDREVHVHPHASYQQVHFLASANFTRINAELVGCGRSVAGVSPYTAQEIQTCTPQIVTMYVCIEALRTRPGALSLRSAHLRSPVSGFPVEKRKASDHFSIVYHDFNFQYCISYNFWLAINLLGRLLGIKLILLLLIFLHPHPHS